MNTFALYHISPNIFYIHFEDHYQLAMHMLRAHEYWKNPVFADRIFTIAEFMEWYVKFHNRTVFTYPADWSGFNVPGWALAVVYESELLDTNKYDQTMKNLFYEHILPRVEHGPFYLIGTSSAGYKGDNNEQGVLDHELAHALYHTNDTYRRNARYLLNCLPQPLFEGMSKLLREHGYNNRSIDDEIHAYAATGVEEFGLAEFLTPDLTAPFEAHFKSYAAKLPHRSSYELITEG